MTPKTILDTLMQRLGSLRNPEMRAKALTEMNLQLQQLEQAPFLPWFLQDEITLTTTAGQDFIQLPDDFLREYEEGIIFVRHPDADDFLVKMSYEDLRRSYRETVSALPVMYALFGGKMILAPVPDQAYEIVFSYYKKSAPFADNTESHPWLQHASNVIAARTGAVMARFHLQNPQLADNFQREAMAALSDLHKAHEARQHSNMHYELSRV